MQCLPQRGRGKPIWGICAEGAYSTAYAIASACDRITGAAHRRRRLDRRLITMLAVLQSPR